MSDLIWIVLDVICIIAFVYFIHCENKNTKVRKEQIKQLKKENELLDEIIRKVNKASKLQVGYNVKNKADEAEGKQVTSKLKEEGGADDQQNKKSN